MSRASRPDEQITRFYEDHVRRFGYGYRGLGFGRRSSQERRFEALLGAREALTEAPEGARFKWRATSEWQNGTHSVSTVDGFFGLGEEQKHRTAFRFDADHPELFASEDKGATPVEFILVGLAGCLTAGIASVAQNRNIQLRSVRATLEAGMDLQGILGIDSDVRNGFDGIKVTYQIDAEPPTITGFAWNGDPITDGAVFIRRGVLSATATDNQGIASAEFAGIDAFSRKVVEWQEWPVPQTLIMAIALGVWAFVILPGGTLEDLVAQTGPLPGPVAACLLSDILQGIAFAQARGDILVMFSEGHIGMARGATRGDQVSTIECNTSSGTYGSQSNGDGCYKRQRNVWRDIDYAYRLSE